MPRSRSIFLAIVVGVLLAAAAVVVLLALRTSQVKLVNATGSELRLSGCFIDESLDIKAGETVTQDVPSGQRWGCDVHPLGSAVYLGCLVVDDHRRAYDLATDVDRSITESACERI